LLTSKAFPKSRYDIIRNKKQKGENMYCSSDHVIVDHDEDPSCNCYSCDVNLRFHFSYPRLTEKQIETVIKNDRDKVHDWLMLPNAKKLLFKVCDTDPSHPLWIANKQTEKKRKKRKTKKRKKRKTKKTRKKKL
tara:strand:+ start:267 stop:668 length:402 start_codon:yes stop_codon:yes gene_type:complete